MNVYLGIDPGEVNLGWFLLSEDRVSIRAGGVINFSKFDSLHDATNFLWSCISEKLPEGANIISGAIERFVPYQGTFTNQSERVCEVIGSLIYCLAAKGINLVKVRAIDWKKSICQYLFLTERFTNPSSSFDKVYSKAVASHITNGLVFKVSHDADACGIAFYAMRCHKFPRKVRNK
jgi:hypothetical protein